MGHSGEDQPPSNSEKVEKLSNIHQRKVGKWPQVRPEEQYIFSEGEGGGANIELQRVLWTNLGRRF